MPAAGGSTPAEWMTLTGQLEDAGTVSADRDGFSAVALGWRQETDTAVAVLIVVPAHKCCYPARSLCHAMEWPPGQSDKRIAGHCISELATWLHPTDR